MLKLNLSDKAARALAYVMIREARAQMHGQPRQVYSFCHYSAATCASAARQGGDFVGGKLYAEVARAVAPAAWN